MVEFNSLQELARKLHLLLDVPIGQRPELLLVYWTRDTKTHLQHALGLDPRCSRRLLHLFLPLVALHDLFQLPHQSYKIYTVMSDLFRVSETHR